MSHRNVSSFALVTSVALGGTPTTPPHGTPADSAESTTGGSAGTGGIAGSSSGGLGGAGAAPGSGGAGGAGESDLFPDWDESTGLGRPEVLYDFGGNGPGKGLRGIVADATHLYWLRDSRDLTRAEKVPGGRLEIVVPDASPTNANQGWVMDPDFLYWDDASRIRRFEKSNGAVTNFPLDGPRAYGTLVVVADETNLYLAEPGCVTMMTMNKVTGALGDIIKITEPNTFRGGWFSIALGGGFVYCSGGAGGVLYRRPITGGPKEEVLRLPDDHPDGYPPQVESMVIVGTTMYLTRGYSSQLPPGHVLAKLDLSATPLGQPQDLAPRIPALGGVMEYDADRQILYWASPLSIQVYAIPTGELRQAGTESFTLEKHPHGSYLTQDRDYVYWHTRDPIVRVFRQKKLDPVIQ